MSLPINKGGQTPVSPSRDPNKGKSDFPSDRTEAVAIQSIKGISSSQNSSKEHSWSHLASTDAPQLNSPTRKVQGVAQGKPGTLSFSSHPKGAPQTHSSSDQSLQDIVESLKEKAKNHHQSAIQAIKDQGSLNSLADITDATNKWVLILRNIFKPNIYVRDAIKVMKDHDCSNVDECLAKLDRSYKDETALTNHFNRKADILNDFVTNNLKEEIERILFPNGIEEFKRFFESSWEELKKFAEQDSPQITQDLIIQLKTLQRFINVIGKIPSASNREILPAMNKLKRECANNLEKFCNSDYLLGQYETALKSVSKQLNSGDLSGLMAQLTEIEEEMALFQYFLDLPSFKEPLTHFFELKAFLSNLKLFNQGTMTSAEQIESLANQTAEIHSKFPNLDNTAIEELYTAYAQAFQVLAMQKTTHTLPLTAPRALLERWMSAMLPSGKAEGTSGLMEAYEISYKNLDTQISAVRQAERELLKAANIQTPSSFNPDIAYAATWQPSLTQIAPSFKTEPDPSIQGISSLQQLQILRAISQSETEINNKTKEVELAKADLQKLQNQANAENARVTELKAFMEKHPWLIAFPGADVCEWICRQIAFFFKLNSWEETANNFAKIANILEDEKKINELRKNLLAQRGFLLDLNIQLSSANAKKESLIEGKAKVEEAWKGLFNEQKNLRKYNVSIERPEELTLLSTVWQPLTAFADRKQNRLGTPISHFSQLQEAISNLEKSLRGKEGIFKFDTAPDAKMKEIATQALLKEAKILREDCQKKINEDLLPAIPSEVEALTSLQEIRLNGNNGALKNQLDTATENLKYLQEISQQLGMTTQLPDQLTIVDQQRLFIELVDQATKNLITRNDLLSLQKQIDSRSNNATPENQKILDQIQVIHNRAAEQLKKEEEKALTIIETNLQKTQSDLALAKERAQKQTETITQLTARISTILKTLTDKLPNPSHSFLERVTSSNLPPLSDSLSQKLQILVENQNDIQQFQKDQNAFQQQDPATKTGEQIELQKTRKKVIDNFNTMKVEFFQDPVIKKICALPQFNYDPNKISPEQLKTLSLVLDPDPKGFIKQLQSHALSSSSEDLITFWRESGENWVDLIKTAPWNALYNSVEELHKKWDLATDFNDQVKTLNEDYNTLSTEKEILELNQQLGQVLQLVDKMKEYASTKGIKTLEAIQSANNNQDHLKRGLTALTKSKLLSDLKGFESSVLEWSKTPLLKDPQNEEEAVSLSIVEATTKAAQTQFEEAIESVNARMEELLIQALKHASDLNKQE